MQPRKSRAHAPLSEDDTRRAAASGRALQQLLGKGGPLDWKATLRVQAEQPGGEETEIMLPASSLPLLSKLLRELGNGKDVVVLATDTELTTEEAADFLQISRPDLVELLEQGKIRYRLVGPRRRVLVRDLLRYKEQEGTSRRQGPDEPLGEDRKFGMY